MKRKIILILVLAFALSVFAACAKVITTENQGQDNESMFVVVETTSLWMIVYHKDTRVMYAVSYSTYSCGHFTLLVDAEGNPLLWDGGSEENG